MDEATPDPVPIEEQPQIIKETNAGTRLASMLLDHTVMTFVAMIFFLPGMISTFSGAFEVSHEEPELFGSGGSIYIMIIGFALYFCKDSINGRSIAKRALNIQVVDNRTGEAASALKCFVRNIFCFLWPIEVIVVMVRPARRIGDMIAGTRVVTFDKQAPRSQPDYWQVGISLILAYGLTLLFMLPYEVVISSMKADEVSFVETSLDEAAGEDLKELFENELGDFLTADVLVYNEINWSPDLKYISVILTLKQDYLEYDQDFETIKNMTLPVLLSVYPEETFVGRVKYVYRESGGVHIRSEYLDPRE